jgi:hypothetical protein
MTTQAVTTVQETPAAMPDSGAIVSMIERAAADPRVDMDKMERLLAMQERILDRNARMAYSTALATMQPLMPVITERGGIKNRDGQVQSSYAKWEDINDAIKPLLAAHGFALSFRTGTTTDGKITVTGILSHREGHQEETTISLPHDSSGSKNAVQAVGSSTSYGKRYTAIALLNITTRGEDDNGKAAPNDWINEDQVGELVALMDDVGADRTRFLNFLKIDSFAHLPKRRFREALDALEAKRRA